MAPNSSRGQYPQVRTQGLVFRQLEDELLVHDTKSDSTHCLDRTASSILRHCDGTTSVRDLRAAVEADTGKALPEDALWIGLEELRTGGLLEAESIGPTRFDGLSRRAMLKRVGVAAAAAAPIITFVTAQPAFAQSVTCVPGVCTCFGNFTPGQTCAPVDCAGGGCVACTVNSACIPQEVGADACNGLCS